MDKWDIIVPHRLLINRSLKKASDDTKKSIAEYKAKFENELRKSEEEIAQAQEEINSKLKKAKQKLEEENRQKAAEIIEEANAKFMEGDILVMPKTNNDMLSLLRRASGIITEEDGVNSHAAVVGLALDIPVITGVINATDILKTGAVVTLDAARGVVSNS